MGWHHNHSESTRKKAIYKNGVMHVVCKIQVGPFIYTFDLQPYLREQTIRRLNRRRPKEQRIHFRSKYTIAHQILTSLKTLLPKGYQVYVLEWYASGKLIKFCRRQGWHVICSTKSNRRLSGKTVRQWDQQLWHQRYTQVRVTIADRTPTEYLVRVLLYIYATWSEISSSCVHLQLTRGQKLPNSRFEVSPHHPRFIQAFT